MMKEETDIKKRKNFFLTLSGVIGVVMIWRGVWQLMDQYLVPEMPEISAVISLIVGIGVIYFNDRSIEELDYKNIFEKKKTLKSAPR